MIITMTAGSMPGWREIIFTLDFLSFIDIIDYVKQEDMMKFKLIFYFLIFCFLSIIIFINVSCDKEDGDDNGTDGPYEPVGVVTLENQTEHSGIAVEILEADTFVLADSSGNYNLSFLSDNDYTLNCVFPYYKNCRQEINISDGKVATRIEDMMLEQILVCEALTEDSIVSLGDSILFRCYAENVSDYIALISWDNIPPWVAVILYDSLIVDSWPKLVFPAGYDDSIFPGDIDSEMVFNWIVNDSLPAGEYQIMCGMLTHRIFNSVIWYNEYFTEWPYITNDKLFGKLKKTIIEIY